MLTIPVRIFGIYKVVIDLNGIIDIEAEGLIKLQLTCTFGVNFLPQVTDITCIFTLTEHKGCARLVGDA